VPYFEGVKKKGQEMVDRKKAIGYTPDYG